MGQEGGKASQCRLKLERHAHTQIQSLVALLFASLKSELYFTGEILSVTMWDLLHISQR